MSYGSDREFGFACLKCQAMTRANAIVFLPGDDAPTYLSVGQRESVFCPRCGDMRQSEFTEVTNSNRSRVVDTTGRACPGVMPSTPFAPPPPPSHVPANPGIFGHESICNAGAPVAMITMTMPPQYATSSLMPAPLAPAPPPVASAHAMSAAEFDVHVARCTDDQLRALRQELGDKLRVTELALSDRKRCIICCDRDKAVVLMPCKHMSMCTVCAHKVDACPVCKAAVVDRIVPYAV